MTTTTTPTTARRIAGAQRPSPAPDRILVIGQEGVGKSSFGASAPNPFFLAAEDGLRHLDVPFIEPKKLTDIHEVVTDLAAGGHEFKTLVIDTVDWLEPLIIRAVCERNKWFDSQGNPDIEFPGYGKGYIPVTEEWRKILARLDDVRAKSKMEIILLAHCKIQNFANPSGPDYSRYELAMLKNSGALLKQWADAVLFAAYEESVATQKARTGEEVLRRGKGMATGRRVLHTERDAAWDAKNRHSLPAVLPLSYQDYAEARARGSVAPFAALIEQMAALQAEAKVTPENVEKTREWVGEDPRRAAQVINRLREVIAQTV